MKRNASSESTLELNQIKIEYSKGKKKKIILIASLGVALIATIITSITLGASSVNFNTVFKVFGDLFVHNDAVTETQRQIVMGIRFPRVLAAILAGIALSNAGLLMQGVFQNPLVSPYTLGVSNGASFGAALAIVFSAHFAFLNEELLKRGWEHKASFVIEDDKELMLKIFNLIKSNFIHNSNILLFFIT